MVLVEESPDAAEQVRLRHLADQRLARPEHLARVDWSADRLAAERLRGLRGIVRVATEQSSWHRARLRDVDPARLTEADLPDLPVMTKDDVMVSFDQIVTDPRITLAGVEAHLASLTDRPLHLLDRYQAIASGGSTGRRGVFVYDWDAWVTNHLGWFRYLLRNMGGRRISIAVIAAGKATHASRALFQTFWDPEAIDRHSMPVTLPLEEIVARLNALKPDCLSGYPSALVPLVETARSGALRITPKAVLTAGEPLLPEMRASLEETFGVPVQNWWLSSEGGPMAIGCGHGPGLHLSDDLLIIEPVDRENRPVPVGTPSAKVLLTNLFNPVMPLIRYELTDEVTMLDAVCPCGSAHRLVQDPYGRQDDCFSYGGILVHPHVFRSILGSQAAIIEYQVHQTPHGARILLRGRAGAQTHDELRRGLEQLGVTRPEISITNVEEIERVETGTIRRFVPLANPS